MDGPCREATVGIERVLEISRGRIVALPAQDDNLIGSERDAGELPALLDDEQAFTRGLGEPFGEGVLPIRTRLKLHANAARRHAAKTGHTASGCDGLDIPEIVLELSHRIGDRRAGRMELDQGLVVTPFHRMPACRNPNDFAASS
ncbi:MAG: hypothetical protein ACK56I_16210 [bacterium]